ncbi:MAG: DUF805 domain-containing protein [Pseudomonadota bacterium]
MLRFYLTARGRISRKATWLAVMLPIIPLMFAAAAADVSLFPEIEFTFLGTVYTPFIAALTVLVAWPSFATSIRRFHDLNMTGWWAALMLALYWTPDFAGFFQMSNTEKAAIVAWVVCASIGGLLALAQLFVRGTIGQNRFGPDPTERD